jgi:hypothetical protein
MITGDIVHCLERLPPSLAPVFVRIDRLFGKELPDKLKERAKGF